MNKQRIVIIRLICPLTRLTGTGCLTDLIEFLDFDRYDLQLFKEFFPKSTDDGFF